MSTIDPSTSVASQVQNSDASIQNTNQEATYVSEDSGDDSNQATDAQLFEAAETIALATVQTSLMMMFPEARRIQQRAESFNKQMLAE